LVESVLIGNLDLGSGARLSVERGRINVTNELTLAPHYYTRCLGAPEYLPAGSCLMGPPTTCSAQTCNWQAPPVCPCEPPRLNATTKQSECYIRKKLCSSDDAPHVPDLSCDWMLEYAREGCFVGPNGKNVFGKDFNSSQKCPLTIP